MEASELKDAVKAKTAQLEQAMELGKSKDELMKLYKELKELHFQLVQSELLIEKQEEFIWHPVTGISTKG
jgi:hypothetical protein